MSSSMQTEAAMATAPAPAEASPTTLPQQLRLAFIGGGNMARSLIGGLLAAGHPAPNIAVAEPDAGQRERLRQLGAIGVGEDNAAAARGADIIVLAVKPQVLQQVCKGLRTGLAQRTKNGPRADSEAEGSRADDSETDSPEADEQLIVSIAAGVRIDALEAWLGERAIVRCMPNTPALLQAGITVLSGNAQVQPRQLERAVALLRAVGKCEVVADEALLDPVTAISGSGPAYFFLFMEALTAAGIEQGLSPEQAHRLVVETALGAARMAAETTSTLTALRVSVTSPNGTTEAALQAFAAGDLQALVRRAALAAHDRSIALAHELAGELAGDAVPRKQSDIHHPSGQSR